MKISYILQLKDFSILLIFGVILGVFYGLINIPNSIKKIQIVQIINDLIFSISFSFIFIVLINYINMGEFRLFLLLGYIFGFAIERITLGKLFAKGYKIVYTSTVKQLKKFANSNIGKVILK